MTKVRANGTATATLKIDVVYDPQVTDPEALASAADMLLETALSALGIGILSEYGDPYFKKFFVVAGTETTT